MKIDFEQYKVQRKLIKKMIDKEGTSMDKLPLKISEFACMSGCPVICVYYYIGEIIGFTPFIRAKMKELTEFYTYKEYENIKGLTYEEINNPDIDTK